MKIKVFNEDGIDEFIKQVNEIRSGTRKDLNTDFLISAKHINEFENEIEIEIIEFATKQELIAYLCERLELKKNKHLYYHRGLWTWLAAFYFNSLTSIGKDGMRKINEDAKYILTDPKNWRRYYRHLLASFARVYCELGDLAVPFLSYPIPIWSDLHEQLFAYQQIATNKPLIAAANKLYWDEKNLKIKKGAGSSGPGTPRRFSAIVGQFEITFDLNAMSADSILSIFPKQEFKKWESAA